MSFASSSVIVMSVLIVWCWLIVFIIMLIDSTLSTEKVKKIDLEGSTFYCAADRLIA
jgi:TM2 domain-containing membrane protein YozV